jgi:hypothetical protein
MRGTASSKPSPSSKRATATVFAALLIFAALAAWWCFSRGYTLYWGDAEAHLYSARRIIDSRTPGYEQIGTVWLPLPHLLMLPVVGDDYLWRTGLAGAIPSVLAFAIAGAGLFSLVRLLFASTAAALCATALFALNPNVLYVSSIPMTESILLAALTWTLYFTARFEGSRNTWAAVGAGFCAAAACLTRYEGWFLLPPLALLFLIRGGLRPAVVFSVIAGAAPLYWLAHNQYLYSNALDFYNGPYSPMAIQGGKPYPGKGDLTTAARYYWETVEHCAGATLLWMGLAGLAAAIWKRAWSVVALLALIPAFYVVNVWGGASPIFVPTLWPGSYYNTRYGMPTLPLLILGAAAIVAVTPDRFRRAVAWLVLLVAIIPWLAYPNVNNWITWKESEVNSIARRKWTSDAAAFIAGHYRPGDGILITAGDPFGVIREAGLTLKDTLHVGNGPHAHAALMRPDLFLWEKWVIGISADAVSSAIMKDMKTARRYKLVRTLHEKHGPVIEIYQRIDDNPIYQGARSEERLPAHVDERSSAR